MSTNWKTKPGFFFFTTCLTMAVLLLAALYFTKTPPSQYHASFSFTAVLPLWVPWAGALGGCTISLVGIVRHGRHWDPTYAYWHLARPLLGGVCGTIGVLIVVLVLKSVSATPATPTGAPPATDVAYDKAGVAVLAVLSFVIGYREQTFRTLIRRVADVILGPGDAGPAAIVAFVPALLELKTKGTEPVSDMVHLFNGSPSALALAASAVTVEPADQGFTAELESEGPLPGNQARGIKVTWKPAHEASAATAVLTGTLGGYTARVQLRGSSDPAPPGEEEAAPPAPGEAEPEAQPDDAVPDDVMPDAVVPDAVVPDAVVPDAAVPDDALVPDAAQAPMPQAGGASGQADTLALLDDGQLVDDQLVDDEAQLDDSQLSDDALTDQGEPGDPGDVAPEDAIPVDQPPEDDSLADAAPEDIPDDRPDDPLPDDPAAVKPLT